MARGIMAFTGGGGGGFLKILTSIYMEDSFQSVQGPLWKNTPGFFLSSTSAARGAAGAAEVVAAVDPSSSPPRGDGAADEGHRRGTRAFWGVATVRRGDHGSGGGSCTGSGRITGSKWFRSWPGGSAIFKAGASNGSLWGFGRVHSVWPGTWLSSICSMGRSCKGSASGVSSSCWDSPIQDASSWEQVLQGTLAAPEPALMVGSIEPSYSTTVSPPISPQHPVLGGGRKTHLGATSLGLMSQACNTDAPQRIRHRHLHHSQASTSQRPLGGCPGDERTDTRHEARSAGRRCSTSTFDCAIYSYTHIYSYIYNYLEHFDCLHTYIYSASYTTSCFASYVSRSFFGESFGPYTPEAPHHDLSYCSPSPPTMSFSSCPPSPRTTSFLFPLFSKRVVPCPSHVWSYFFQNSYWRHSAALSSLHCRY